MLRRTVKVKPFVEQEISKSRTRSKKSNGLFEVFVPFLVLPVLMYISDHNHKIKLASYQDTIP